LAADWTSLETARLIASLLTPLVVVALGFMVTKAVGRIEDAQWSDRKLIERRIKLYDEMAGPLNDLFCFFWAVGHFREVTPPDAIATKRALDKAFFANRFLMTDEFTRLYHGYIDTCFVQGERQGHDARLRASRAYQRDERGTSVPWKNEWNDLFVDDPADVTTDAEVDRTYGVLMRRFAAECGVVAADESR
jgi:hypothetical protein